MIKHQKHQSIVYSVNEVDFTIYAIPKPTKSGPKVYWVLDERLTTGKRRLLNNKTLEAAKERADEIVAANLKGKASRMALSDGQVQDFLVAREALRSAKRFESVGSIVTYKLDRLGRSITHLCLLVDELTRLNIPLVCSSQGSDTSGNNPCGKFQLDVLKAVCEFERNLIRDRVNSGLAAARARGVRLGRPTSLHKRAGDVLALKKNGLGVRAISRKLGMAVSSVHSVLTTSKGKR